MNLRGLAVDRCGGATLGPAEDLADALVAQADAERRHARAQPLDERGRDTGLARRARARRDDDVRRRQRRGLVYADGIVAAHQHIGAQLREILVEVVGKAVVVVDQEEHAPSPPARRSGVAPARSAPCPRPDTRAARRRRLLAPPRPDTRAGTSVPSFAPRRSASSTARSTAPSLLSASRNSACGTESATMPPPACA